MNQCQFFLIIKYAILIALFLVSKSQNTNCFTSTFVTLQTQCEMKFLICNKTTVERPNPDKDIQFKSQLQYIDSDIIHDRRFESCRRRKCLRQLINGQCRFQQYFDLNEQACFRQCCGSTHQFNSDRCIQYNKSFQQRQQVLNNFLIIFFSVVLGLLLIVFFLFLVCKMRCWRNNQSHLANSKISKKYKKWKKVNGFEVDAFNKCQLCKREQANFQTNCHHWYHVECLQRQTINQECPRCFKQLRLTNINLYCQNCWKQYLVISFKGIPHLKCQIQQSTSQHYQQCMKRDLPSTDVRLTHDSCT